MSEEWSFEKDDFLTTTPYEALYAYDGTERTDLNVERSCY